jgi:hypothetical protein
LALDLVVLDDEQALSARDDDFLMRSKHWSEALRRAGLIT